MLQFKIYRADVNDNANVVKLKRSQSGEIEIEFADRACSETGGEAGTSSVVRYYSTIQLMSVAIINLSCSKN